MEVKVEVKVEVEVEDDKKKEVQVRSRLLSTAIRQLNTIWYPSHGAVSSCQRAGNGAEACWKLSIPGL